MTPRHLGGGARLKPLHSDPTPSWVLARLKPLHSDPTPSWGRGNHSALKAIPYKNNSWYCATFPCEAVTRLNTSCKTYDCTQHTCFVHKHPQKIHTHTHTHTSQSTHIHITCVDVVGPFCCANELQVHTIGLICSEHRHAGVCRSAQ